MVSMLALSQEKLLLHALASSDGLTVNNVDNIQLLLERGASLHVKQQLWHHIEKSVILTFLSIGVLKMISPWKNGISFKY